MNYKKDVLICYNPATYVQLVLHGNIWKYLDDVAEYQWLEK
ncbi:MAG: DUF6061 family protein [Roseburia sp.]